MSKSQPGRYILHHGSDVDFATPRWNAGDKHRDFGQCFYTTYDLALATTWANQRTVRPRVYHYCLDLRNQKSCQLKVKRFEANEEWARFVYNNRYNSDFVRPDYDIIIGPIADNHLADIFATMNRNKQTFEDIAPKLKYEKYQRAQMQVCFCSEQAIALLSEVKI